MPPVYRVILQPEAFRNLDAILDYIKRDSPQNAVKMIDRLWDATQSLKELPRGCKIYRSGKRPDYVVHSMPVSPSIVYYRVIEKPPIVRILTIRHGARRQPRRFK
jgi:plasmid stabilization system protein ParE